MIRPVMVLRHVAYCIKTGVPLFTLTPLTNDHYVGDRYVQIVDRLPPKKANRVTKKRTKRRDLDK